MKILLVEDNYDIAISLSKLLERRGHQVDIADSVKSAKMLLNACKYEMLISDLGLPDGSGLDVIHHAKQVHCPHSIAISGYTDINDRQVTAEAGFELHLSKPVSVAEIENAILQLTR